VKFLKNYPVVVLILAALVLSNVYTVFAVQTNKSTDSSQVPKGDKGDQGADGVNGAQGPEGKAGEAGSEGAVGANGLRGAAGAAGANGSNGSNGTNGLQGLTGQAGLPGQNGSPSIALLHGSVTTASPSDIDTTIPVDAVNGNYGVFQQVVTSPTTGYNPGDQIAQFNYWSVGLVDTRARDYNVGITIQVCDTNRNRCIVLTGWAHADNSVAQDSATLTPQDLSVESSIGSGLSYDSSTGKIMSSDGFGGEFSVVIDYVGTLS
jgi:hypothetical protein